MVSMAFFEVPNRGVQTLFEFFNNVGVPGADTAGSPEDQAEFGDGLLLTQGYTIVWVGWHFGIPRGSDDIGIDLPIAMENRKPVTERVVAPFTVDVPSQTLDLDPDSAAYPPVDLNSSDAVLTVVQNIYDPPRVILRNQWQFARAANGQVIPDATSLYLRGGFVPGQTYQVSYTAKNTPVGGLGLAALRDVASAFRKLGAPVSANYEYVFGMSQTGRFLREFLYEGFKGHPHGAAPAPFSGTITPNQGVLPPVQVVVAVWIPVAVAAFASETIPGVTLGATVIPVYPVPGLAVKLQQGTSVTANIRSLALTVEPLVVIVAVVPPVEFPACPKLSTFSKQALIGEQDAANDPAFHSVIFNCK